MQPVGPASAGTSLIRSIRCPASRALALPPAVRSTPTWAIGDLLRRVGIPRRELDRLAEAVGGTAADPGRPVAAGARTTGDLGLDLRGTAATLQSAEEVNTVPTSYTPFGPSFTAGSTSEPTLSGTYTGSTDDTLTFKVKRVGTVGGNKEIRFEVRDGQSNLLENVSFAAGTPAGTPVQLGIGIALSLGAGDVDKNDTLQVEVSVSEPGSVDPDEAFDGVRNENPGFEPGVQVTAGSFEINGVSIGVLADDTINSVLSRINGAGAGVSATFHPQSEKVILEHDTPGAAGQVDLANDSSGFLAAVKLDTATLVPGTDPDTARLLSESPPSRRSRAADPASTACPSPSIRRSIH